MGIIPHIYPHFRGNHLHHFNYGIIALVLAGFLSISGSKISKNIQAIIYGIGLGLVVDEIGLLISLQNDYWTRQAFDGLVIVAVILVNIEFFRDFWAKNLRKLLRKHTQSQFALTTKLPKISIVIPAHNEEKSIALTLKSLKNQDYTGKIEIIVVDNNSTDKTAKIAKKYGARIVFEQQKGVGYARQAGFMAAKGQIIASTDSDTIVPKNWLSWYVKKFQQHPEAIMLSGMYKFNDANAALNFWNWLLNYPQFVIFGWYSGANMAVLKTAFQKIGGFNAELPLSEDSDLGVRLRRLGRVYRYANFKVETSARRFNQLGLLGAIWDYCYNYIRFKLHIKQDEVSFRSGSEIPKLGTLPRLAIKTAVISVVLFTLLGGIMEIKPVKAAVVKRGHEFKTHLPRVNMHSTNIRDFDDMSASKWL